MESTSLAAPTTTPQRGLLGQIEGSPFRNRKTLVPQRLFGLPKIDKYR